MKIIISEQQLKRIIKESQKDNNYNDSQEDCLYKRNKLGKNSYWFSVQKECIECPDGKSLIYPDGECGDCPKTQEYFVSQFGCEKKCKPTQFFNRESGQCEEIPIGKWYDGENILDIEENEDIKMYWDIENQNRMKNGKNILNPSVKPTDPEELKDWNKINTLINHFIRKDVIINKSKFIEKGEWQYENIKGIIKQKEDCGDFKKCEPLMM
jgi:hypothetical protein